MTSRQFKYGFAFPRREAPEFCMNRFAQENRGRRKCRVPAAPAASRAKLNKAHERSHHRCRRIHPGIPRAMVLRLISCSPRRRIRLVTVIRGLRFCLRPVGPTRLRELDTSNGCQNPTALPSASTSLLGVPFARSQASPTRPASRHTLNAAASTASRPASVTIAIRPLCGTGRLRMYNGFDFGKTEIFFRSGLDKAKAQAVPDLHVGQIQYVARMERTGLGQRVALMRAR